MLVKAILLYLYISSSDARNMGSPPAGSNQISADTRDANEINTKKEIQNDMLSDNELEEYDHLRTTPSEFSPTEQSIPDYLLPNITEEYDPQDNATEPIPKKGDQMDAIDEAVDLVEETVDKIAETVGEVMDVIIGHKGGPAQSKIHKMEEMVKEISESIVEAAGFLAKVPYPLNMLVPVPIALKNNSQNDLGNRYNGTKSMLNEEKIVEVAEVVGNTVKIVTETVGQTIESIVATDSQEIVSMVRVVEDVVGIITDGVVDVVTLMTKGLSILTSHQHH